MEKNILRPFVGGVFDDVFLVRVVLKNGWWFIQTVKGG